MSVFCVFNEFLSTLFVQFCSIFFFFRNLHHNTKQFIQFITTKGTFVPNYMSRRPNRPKNTQNGQNNNSPLKLKVSNLKKCHICLYYTDTFVIKNKKVFCEMCILKTNQEKLLWYLNDNHAPPCLSMDFERIERSTAMTRDEITAFYRYKIFVQMHSKLASLVRNDI